MGYSYTKYRSKGLRVFDALGHCVNLQLFWATNSVGGFNVEQGLYDNDKSTKSVCGEYTALILLNYKKGVTFTKSTYTRNYY